MTPSLIPRLSPASEEAAATRPPPDPYLLEYAATTIQKIFRGYQVRKHNAQQVRFAVATGCCVLASVVPTAACEHLCTCMHAAKAPPSISCMLLQWEAQIQQRRQWESQHEEEVWLHICAQRIQNAWKRFRNKRIYQYYRDLIQFR